MVMFCVPNQVVTGAYMKPADYHGLYLGIVSALSIYYDRL